MKIFIYKNIPLECLSFNVIVPHEFDDLFLSFTAIPIEI